MEDIDAKIRELKRRKEQLQKARVQAMFSKLLKKEDFTLEHKGQIFDELHDQVMQDVEYLGEYGRYPDDHEYYLWETAVTIMLGEGGFKFIREMLR